MVPWACYLIAAGALIPGLIDGQRDFLQGSGFEDVRARPQRPQRQRESVSRLSQDIEHLFREEEPPLPSVPLQRVLFHRPEPSRSRTQSGRSQLPEESVSSECPTPNGVFADSYQCDRYYECVDNVISDKLCPDGLAYDDKYPKGRCEFLYAVDCTGREELHQDLISKFQCPENVTEELGGGRDGQRHQHPRYFDPDDCQTFYVCIDGVNPRKNGCPLGKVFNDVTKQCDDPKNVPECAEWYKDDPRFLTSTTTTPATGSLSPTRVGEAMNSKHPTPSSPQQEVTTNNGGRFSLFRRPTGALGLAEAQRRKPNSSSIGNLSTTDLALPVLLSQGQQSLDVRCEDNDFYVPDPYQCDKYYECIDGVASESKLCPDGLVFDDTSRRGEKCDYPFNVNCGNRLELQAPTSSSIECPRQNGIFAHEDPAVCNSFYLCVDGVHQTYQCDGELQFNEYTGVCEWPTTAGRTGCLTKPKETRDGFRCEQNNTLELNGVQIIHPLFPHPTDCQKFYICLNGIDPRENACEDLSVFNDLTMKCDDPQNVPGCEDWFNYGNEVGNTQRRRR
ncbi:unnamed protein product [Cyprideis torosa]|uniref:Uncharacterized protein n=1 Tax=Cyprideis torosa TaxID=163714 RepID=A0A7R8W4Z1_9CRUS|nr:unnamed protein product [Cyprideis torosa]CAG0880326.1 unnamed protein product [Cyprideis torosa]